MHGHSKETKPPRHCGPQGEKPPQRSEAGPWRRFPLISAGGSLNGMLWRKVRQAWSKAPEVTLQLMGKETLSGPHTAARFSAACQDSGWLPALVLLPANMRTIVSKWKDINRKKSPPPRRKDGKCCQPSTVVYFPVSTLGPHQVRFCI